MAVEFVGHNILVLRALRKTREVQWGFLVAIDTHSLHNGTW